MPEFKWDDEADPMDGYDTEPDLEPTLAPAPKPMPQASKPKPTLPKIPEKSKVAEVLDDLEDSPDPAELTEAEWRLEKAGYYRAVINSQLLSSDHPAAVEVEVELQQWAKEQLEMLLGLRTKESAPANVQVANQFTDEEAEILRQLVSKVQSRATSAQPPVAQATPPPAPAPSKQPTMVQPVTAKPKAQVTPVTAQEMPRRGRGRPRKNPCRFCGKMECEHKRTAPQSKPQQTQPQATPNRQLSASQPASGETYDGIPIQIMEDGTKVIETQGRRYKLEVRQMTHRETGEVRNAYVPIELSTIKKPPTALPYPPEHEAMRLASLEADRNAQSMERLTGATTAIGAPMKFTGSDLVKAAMAAPEREPYIPEPPPKKR